MPKFEEIAHKGRCDVCGKQTDVAVCASSCGPISLAYCRSCLEAGLEPYGIMLAYISGAGHWPDDINPACIPCSILNVGIQLVFHLGLERSGTPSSLMTSGFCRKLHVLTVRPEAVHTADQGVCHLALEVGTAVTSTGDTSFCGKPSAIAYLL